MVVSHPTHTQRGIALINDDWCSDGSERGDRLCLLHLQDYAVDTEVHAGVKTPIRLTRVEPVAHAQSQPHSVPAG